MSKKILIVEDNATLVSLMRARLENSGYEVISAEEGEEGLRSMKEEKPDLVILDIKLPIMDGFEVCRLAKNNPELKSIPIIFVTALAQEQDLKKGKEVGGDGYITKPYDGNNLLDEIGKFLK